MLHHRTWFPAVVALLTLGLGVVVAVSLKDRPASSPESEPRGSFSAPVDQATYRRSLASTLSEFETALAAGGDDLEKLMAIDAALESVLRLSVPAEERDLHLSVAVALNQMRNGLRGEEGMFARGRAGLDATYERAPWLK